MVWSHSVVLALEASTAAGSVALWVDGVCAGVRPVTMGMGREDFLFPAMQALLANASLAPTAVQAVVCGEGPGSFTSLRIAGALAKGLAHGVGCPLYAVPSLLIAAAAIPHTAAAGRFLVHSDALRGERYVVPVTRTADGRVAAAGPLARIGAEALRGQVPAAERVTLGAHPDFPDDLVVLPTLERLSLIEGEWQRSPVDLARWEPAYGRLAEAQVKWEATHGTSLPAS